MKQLQKIALYIILITVGIGMIFPMFWMILLSLKEYPDSYTSFWQILTANFSLKNYADAFSSDTFDIYFLNSFITATCVTAGNLLFCTWAGYALARRKFLGQTLVMGTILGVLIIPPHVIMIPLYRLMVNFSWINTYWALIIPWIVSPFGIFMIKQYIETMPPDIEAAAEIDGAGQWYILFRVVMPICRPILTVLGIYTFLSNWNSFLFPFLFTNDAAYRTLPVGLTFYLGKQSIDWGHLMAGASISAIPVLIIFAIFQKQVVRGLTSGALKE